MGIIPRQSEIGDADLLARSNEAPDDPDKLSRLVLRKRRTDDAYTLRYWREDYLTWNGVAYCPITTEEIRAEMHIVVKAELDRINRIMLAKAEDDKKPPVTVKVTRGLITNIEEAVRSIVIVPSLTQPPTWLDGVSVQTGELIAMENGLLDVSTCQLLSHSPSYFTLTRLPYAFEAAAACPKWFAFLKRNLEDDAERIALLQEWFGLNLVYDSTFHKFFVMEGEGANGKSVICAVLEAMLGKDNCSFVPLEIFGERFQLTPSVGKLANIIPECGEIDRVAEGFLKSFVSGDSMAFDHKNKTPLQCAPTARITLATNNRPRFSDRSGGLWRRMILMPMRIVIPDSERVMGLDKPDWWRLQAELPGIFRWALDGLARLRKQNRFTRAKVCEDALADYRLESNPARMFLEDRCEAAPDAKVNSATLYAGYTRWAKNNGYSPLASTKFGGEIRRVYPKVQRRQDGRIWHYFGIAFNEYCE